MMLPDAFGETKHVVIICLHLKFKFRPTCIIVNFSNCQKVPNNYLISMSSQIYRRLPNFHVGTNAIVISEWAIPCVWVWDSVLLWQNCHMQFCWADFICRFFRQNLYAVLLGRYAVLLGRLDQMQFCWADLSNRTCRTWLVAEFITKQLWRSQSSAYLSYIIAIQSSYYVCQTQCTVSSLVCPVLENTTPNNYVSTSGYTLI